MTQLQTEAEDHSNHLLAYSIAPHSIKTRSSKSNCVEEIPPQQLKKVETWNHTSVQDLQLLISNQNLPVQGEKQVEMYVF